MESVPVSLFPRGGDDVLSQAPTGQDHGGDSCHPGTQLAALWSKPDLTLGDWIEAGVIHAEFGDHLERLADERGKGAVSGVLERLKDLRTIRTHQPKSAVMPTAPLTRSEDRR